MNNVKIYIAMLCLFIFLTLTTIPLLYYRSLEPPLNGVVLIVSKKCTSSKIVLEKLKDPTVVIVDANAVPQNVLVALADRKAQQGLWTTRRRIPMGSTLAVASAQQREHLNKVFNFKNECPHFALMKHRVCIATETGFKEDGNRADWVNALFTAR